MLVLTRKTGETIHIGSDIKVTVLSVEGTSKSRKVRIGIDAPDDARILRGELVDRDSLEGRAA